MKQDAEIKLKVEKLIFEHSQDVVIGITRIIPDFTGLLSYSDIYYNQFGKGKNSAIKHNNTSLQRKLKLMVPIYFIRKEVTKGSLNSQKPVLKY